MSDVVKFTKSGHIAIIQLDRPEARNAINGAVAQGIESAIDQLENDQELWVGILTATPPVFCAGADLKEIGAGRAQTLVTERGGFAGIVQRERTKPLIAAVDGPALAGGLEVMLACDLAVASTNARFGIPEVKRSLAAAGGAMFRLGRRIPLTIAMELALTGDPIDAAKAERFGLINTLCEPGQVLEAATELADRICANAPVAVRETKKVVDKGTWAPDEQAWAMSMAAFDTACNSEDFKEGINAFVEKRPPRWTGA